MLAAVVKGLSGCTLCHWAHRKQTVELIFFSIDMYSICLHTSDIYYTVDFDFNLGPTCDLNTINIMHSQWYPCGFIMRITLRNNNNLVLFQICLHYYCTELWHGNCRKSDRSQLADINKLTFSVWIGFPVYLADFDCGLITVWTRPPSDVASMIDTSLFRFTHIYSILRDKSEWKTVEPWHL